jgi:hypothetical protein
MDNNKVSADLPNNISSKPEISLKFKIIPVILIFSLLIGFSLYFFKDTFLSILNKKVDNKDISTEVSEPEKDSLFGNLVSDLEVESDVKYYIDLYDEYKMGEMGRRYIFKSFDKATMSLKLSERGKVFDRLDEADISFISLKLNERREGDEIERSFSLAEDFLIVCTIFDIGKYGLDFSNLDDTDKYITALKSSSMTIQEKFKVLEGYPVGSTVGLIFDNDSNYSNSKIKKVFVVTSNLDECYSYEE